MTAPDSGLSRRARLALLLVFAAIWLASIDYRKLVDPDEGRYAEIAREMLVSGDWLTPHLDGLKYFEKPPLQYWATATAFALFGQHEWTARLWPAATGLACVLLVLFTGSRLFGPSAGLLAAAVLASSLLFLLIGHINTLDMGLTLFLQAGVSAFLLAQRQAPGSATERRTMLCCYAALALAALSKGLVSLALPVAALLAYSLASRDFSPWRRLHLGAGLALFLAIAAPWHIAVALANADFAQFYFIHEHFERFLTKGHGRYQPWWYFLPILAAGALPWTLVAAQALAGAWRRGDASPPRRFLFAWCLVVFLFFSASGSKLASYILPLFPALALLTGDFLARIGRRALLVHLALAAALAALALLLSARVPGLARQVQQQAPMAAYAYWLAAAAALWLAGALAALALAWRRRPRPALLALAAATLLAGSTALLGHERFARTSSSYYLVQQLPPIPPVPFYSLRMYDQTLPFYLGRTLTLVEYRDELSFGLEREPDKGLPTVADFSRRWRLDPAAYAVMEPATYRELVSQELPMQVVAQDSRRIVVKKP